METSGRTDRRTDGGDCITSHTIAVGKMAVCEAGDVETSSVESPDMERSDTPDVVYSIKNSRIGCDCLAPADGLAIRRSMRHTERMHCSVRSVYMTPRHSAMVTYVYSVVHTLILS